MRALLACEGGNFAVMFALLTVPVFAAAGMAVDYSRAMSVKESVQNQVDATALDAVHDGPTGNSSARIEFLRSAVIEHSGARIEDLEVDAKWLSPTDIQVTATGVVPLTILSAIPGFSDGIPLTATATARISEPKYVYSPPTVAQLDPEATDYNRLYVYCFDPMKHDNRGNRGRTKMTAIADNAGTDYHYKMPSCKEGQALSYRLVNVRDARATPARWNDRHAERHEYFTDTVLRNGVETYDLDRDILETVLCDRIEDCRSKSEGGILPQGKNRTPERNRTACAPGKFMYYGWEDRPPGTGWTDKDYDDIRIVISCPKIEAVGDRTVRLID